MWAVVGEGVTAMTSVNKHRNSPLLVCVVRLHVDICIDFLCLQRYRSPFLCPIKKTVFNWNFLSEKKFLSYSLAWHMEERLTKDFIRCWWNSLFFSSLNSVSWQNRLMIRQWVCFFRIFSVVKVLYFYCCKFIINSFQHSKSCTCLFQVSRFHFDYFSHKFLCKSELININNHFLLH